LSDFDTSDFDRGMKKSVAKTVKGARNGMLQALLQLDNDVDNIEPKVPLDEGTLRANTGLYVDGKLASEPQALPVGHNDATQQPPQELPSAGEEGKTVSVGIGGAAMQGSIVGVYAMFTKYAARHHEVPANFKRSGAGNKFLEAKLFGRGKTYFQIIADAIKKELKG